MVKKGRKEKNPDTIARSGIKVRLAIKISILMTLFMIFSLLLASWFTSSFQREYTSLWLLIYFIFLMAVSIIFTLVLDRLITKPLNRLIELTTQTEKMGYQIPIEVQSKSEIGLMAKSMERLRLSFLDKKKRLEDMNVKLDKLVEERTDELKRTTLELKKAQKRLVQREKLASIGELAGGVAHEINNPTSIILNRIEYIMEKGVNNRLSPEDIEDMRVIREQAIRISKITSGLITFSRDKKFEMEAVDIKAILDECFDYLIHDFSKKGCGIEKAYDDVSVTFFGNRERLVQAFINIMKNSLEAMDAGGILTISASVDGEKLLLEFKDNGAGIPQEVLPRIFDPFFTTKKTGEGTGLGLAVTYGIVQEHKGGIEVKSTEGMGTSVLLTFPIKSHGRRKRS